MPATAVRDGSTGWVRLEFVGARSGAVTYHGGEALAQGFAHNFAGITMFAVALLILFGSDVIIGRFLPNSDRQLQGPASLSPKKKVAAK